MPTGQLYVNLSTEQNSPNWVSVCSIADPSNLYWTDDNSMIWKWDGAAVSNFAISPWDAIGTLTLGPDKLVGARWGGNPPSLTGVTSYEVDLALTTKTNWPAHEVSGVKIDRQESSSPGVYDPDLNVYWLTLDPNTFTLGSAPVHPVLGKFNASTGALISVHADNDDFYTDATDHYSSNLVLHDGWLYWTGDSGANMSRFNTSTEAWEWVHFGASNPHAVIGFTDDGELVLHRHVFIANEDYFEIFALSDFTWGPVTADNSYGNPAPTPLQSWQVGDGGVGLVPGSGGLAGWAIIASGHIYFTAETNRLEPERWSIWRMSLSTGSISEVLSFDGYSWARGLCGLGVATGGMGHFNTNATGVTWTQVHLGDFYVNTAVSGTPTWYTCCSHGVNSVYRDTTVEGINPLVWTHDDPVVVGSSGQWSDNSDATYAEIVSWYEEDTGDVHSTVASLDIDPVASAGTSFYIRMRVEKGAGTASNFNGLNVEIRANGDYITTIDPGTTAKAEINAATSPTWVNWQTGLMVDYAALASALTSTGVTVSVWDSTVADLSPVVTLTIYELELVIVE